MSLLSGPALALAAARCRPTCPAAAAARRRAGRRGGRGVRRRRRRPAPARQGPARPPARAAAGPGDQRRGQGGRARRGRRWSPARCSRARDRRDLLVGGAVVAGTANLLNLLDLRPGRALKAGARRRALLLGQPARRRPPPRCCRTTCGERTMLGDAGANALGACSGWPCCTARRAAGARGARRAGGAHAASEVVSFSRVIDAVPPLRWAGPGRPAAVRPRDRGCCSARPAGIARRHGRRAGRSASAAVARAVAHARHLLRR